MANPKRKAPVVDLTLSDDEAPPSKIARHHATTAHLSAAHDGDSDDESDGQHELMNFTQSADDNGVAFVQVGNIGMLANLIVNHFCKIK